ncbi:eppin isoform X1 [Magallana gigas]|uniref:eppin isoform X1 n=1 Tax=Magallana gigas TaxID=29159 RepID=UPI0033409490
MLLIVICTLLFALQAQGQNTGSPFPAPFCPYGLRTKPGQCNLQMISPCDCNLNNIRCGHDGECPSNYKCCSWGCGCRDMCVPPGVTEWPVERPLSSRCELPVVAGPCKARILRYYFNRRTGRCETFFYGGCCGNANNFETLSACTSICQSNSYK